MHNVKTESKYQQAKFQLLVRQKTFILVAFTGFGQLYDARENDLWNLDIKAPEEKTQ